MYFFPGEQSECNASYFAARIAVVQKCFVFVVVVVAAAAAVAAAATVLFVVPSTLKLPCVNILYLGKIAHELNVKKCLFSYFVLVIF